MRSFWSRLLFWRQPAALPGNLHPIWLDGYNAAMSDVHEMLQEDLQLLERCIPDSVVKCMSQHVITRAVQQRLPALREDRIMGR